MSKKSQKPKYILMVCVDNICRSPVAEAVMRAVIAQNGLQYEWHVDSAAIEAWHVGAPPDPRVLSVLGQHKIVYNGCARRLVADDFQKFDYIFGMDHSNMASLRLLEPHYAKANLLLLGDFLFGLKPTERIIDDPYYLMGEEPFEKIFKQCSCACSNFLKQARSGEIIT
ncbi:low molecular weight phosphotyrosine protein phosphatase 2 [Drosophila grimshawi]|uniref:GH14045 n=1 Tax=Drosophila grimshawi TaxID=7222 RepID=B4JYC2_DROGR|nr:low molecular weight phosphotyrosine protein phosphatase 2 [Drosophila grimshawi]EDV90684.1 GH14045 [Drosophila grimshawi]